MKLAIDDRLRIDVVSRDRVLHPQENRLELVQLLFRRTLRSEACRRAFENQPEFKHFRS